MPPRRKPPVSLTVETPSKLYLPEYTLSSIITDSRQTSHSTITSQHQSRYLEEASRVSGQPLRDTHTPLPIALTELAYPPPPPPKIPLWEPSPTPITPSDPLELPSDLYADTSFTSQHLSQSIPGRPRGPRRLPDSFVSGPPLTSASASIGSDLYVFLRDLLPLSTEEPGPGSRWTDEPTVSQGLYTGNMGQVLDPPMVTSTLPLSSPESQASFAYQAHNHKATSFDATAQSHQLDELRRSTEHSEYYSCASETSEGYGGGSVEESILSPVPSPGHNPKEGPTTSSLGLVSPNTPQTSVLGDPLVHHPYRHQFPEPNIGDYEDLEIKLISSESLIAPQEAWEWNVETNRWKLGASPRREKSVSPLKAKNELPPTPLSLPTLPFSASSLVVSQYQQCGLAISSLATLWNWCKLLPIWSQGSVILRGELEKALLGLFKWSYRMDPGTMPVALEGVAHSVVSSLIGAKALEDTSDGWPLEGGESGSSLTFNGKVMVSGVFPVLAPCYCSDNHEETSFRCYSSLCAFHFPASAPFDLTRLRSSDHNQWYTFWDVRKEEVERIGKDTVERQCSLFEILKLTYLMVSDGERFVSQCGASFLDATPPLVSHAERFYEYCFGTVEALVGVMRKELLEPMTEIFNREGKFVRSSLSRFFLNFVRELKLPLLNYATYKVYVIALIDHELEKRSSRFAQWYTTVDGSGVWAKFFKYINYIIYPIDVSKPFETLLKLTPPGSEDYSALGRVLRSLQRLNIRSDEMYYVSQNHQALQKLRAQLYWKHIPKINLNLTLKNRKLLHHDSVYENRLLGSDTTVDLVLLDNYLLITEATMKDTLRLKVVERPIPMEYLVVEMKDENGEERPDIKTAPSYSLKLDKKFLKPSTTTTSLTSAAAPVQPTVFSFKVRYAGESEAHTYYVKERLARDMWRDKIIKARTALFGRIRPTEPFQLNAISDLFAYDPVKLWVCAPGHPLRLAAERLEGPPPRSLMTSRVNCAASLTIDGVAFNLIGLDYGVYMAPAANPRGWRRVLGLRGVHQIGVMASFDLVLILSDKSLSYYASALQIFAAAYAGNSAAAVGTKLLYKDIECFKIGSYKGSVTLFLISHVRSKSNSKFRVLYPIRDPATDRFDSFSKDYIYKFVMQAECYGLSVFKTVFAVHTSKGFEVMSLDNLRPGLIPILPPPSESRDLEAIRQKLNGTVRAMGMFKLNNNQEFLLVYSDFAVFTNPLGELSRAAMLSFRFRCTSINFYDNYLVLVCPEAAEVWAISDDRAGSNKLVQVVTGQEMRMLGGEDDSVIRLVAAHPETLGRQLVLEVVANQTVGSLSRTDASTSSV